MLLCPRLGSAGEPAGHHGLPWAGQFPDGTSPTGDRHQHGFCRSGDFRSRAVSPVQVGRRQAYSAGEAPPGQFGAAQAGPQDPLQPLSRDLARHTQRATNVLMMDGDVEQGKPAPENGGHPLWPQ